MKLAGIDVRAYAMPLCRPFETAAGTIVVREGFILELRDDTGIKGYGEAAPVYWGGGESLAVVRDALTVAEGLVQGGLELERASVGGILPGPPSVVCAIDSALCDIEAQHAGITVAELLGGKAPTVQNISALVFGDTPDEVAEQAAALCSAGYAAVKLKVGTRDQDADLARVRAAADALVGTTRLRLDANRAWEPTQAASFLGALAGLPIEFIEEPLATNSADDWCDLKRTVSVKLAADESVDDVRTLHTFLDAGAADFVVIKLARLGGPSAAHAIAETAIASGCETVVTDSIETSVGQLAALHTAAATSRPSAATGLGGARLLAGEDPSPFAPRQRSASFRFSGTGFGYRETR